MHQYLKYFGEQSNATEDRLYRELTAQYNALEVEIKAREAACSNLCRQHLDQKNIERNVPAPIEITPTDCPSKPSQDPRLAFTAGAMVLGLGAAGGTAVLTRRKHQAP